MEYDEFKQIVTENNQEHLIKLYERLNDEEKESLLDQVSKINFAEIKSLYALTKEKKNW